MGALVLGISLYESLAQVTTSCKVEGLRDFTSPSNGSSNPPMNVYTLLESDRFDTINETLKNSYM